MKKLTTILIALSLLILPVAVFAQGGGGVGANIGMEGNAPGGYGNVPNDIVTLVHRIEQIVGLVFGAIAVVLFVMAGIMFLTAQGDPEKVKTARNAFIWGVVGVLVGLVAYGIIALVSSMVT